MARRPRSILQPRRNGAGGGSAGDERRALHGRAPDATARLVDSHLWALVYGLSCYRHVAAGRPLETYQEWADRVGLLERAGDLS